MSWQNDLLKEFNLESPNTDPIEQPPVQQDPGVLSWQDQLTKEYQGDNTNQEPSMQNNQDDPERFNPDLIDLDKILTEYEGASLIKEEIIQDDRLMEVVYQNLEARNKPAGFIRSSGRALAASSGAMGQTLFSGGTSGPRDYRKMEKEDVFEMWQNYQRSFAGGQTVTTANEVVYGMNANEDVKSKLGAGYYLFDKMDNAFTGRGSTSEMFDAIGDYTRAGIYDPATILSFGLGKVVSFGATKASSVAARSLLIKGYQNYIKQGMTKTAARRAVGQAAVKAAPITVADALIEVVSDAGYQKQLMNTGIQEKYSLGQAALSMGGAAFIPGIFLGTTAVKELRKSKLLKKTFLNYDQISKDVITLSPEKAKELLKERVRANPKSISVNVKRNFELKKEKDSRQFLNWEEIKKDSAKGIAERGEEAIETTPFNSFFSRLLFGDLAEGKDGFIKTLEDQGWTYHPALMKDNKLKITGVYAEAVRDYLPDDVAKLAMQNFEKSTGKKLGLDYTAKALSDNYIAKVSEGAGSMWISSQLARLAKQGVSADKALMDLVNGADIASGKKKKQWGKGADQQDVNAFGLSVYKRALTSHLSTTGANLKGFGAVTGLNTIADFATAAINISQSGMYKLSGNSEKTAMYKNRAWGSALGALRRGVSVMSPELEYDFAVKILDVTPDIRAKLFRDVAGDGGVQDSLTHHNIDPSTRGYGTIKAIDTATKGAQTLTLVRMQDELTKTWAFGNNVNQQIMREYGVNPNVFFARKDAAIEMATSKFRKDVLEKAVFRTMRETASVNWSTLEKQSNNSMRQIASGIEYLTNKTGLGYLVPFGSFLNTTLALAGDLSGVNFARTLVKKYRNQDLDYATQEGSELLGKMITGYSALAVSTYAAGGAIDRIKEGLSWNQERNNDGSIEDFTYDWPISTIRVVSQMLGHVAGPDRKMNIFDFNLRDVPEDLIAELGMQLGGQAIRDLKGFERELYQYGTNIIGAFEGDVDDLKTYTDLTQALFVPPAMRILSGVSRPLDPIDFTMGLVMGNDMTPDLKTGPKLYAQGFRYVNNLFDAIPFGVEGMEMKSKSTSTRGFDQQPNVGKQLLSVRGDREVNYIQYVLNSAGMDDWRTIKIQAPAEVKNYMNGVAEAYLNEEALKALKKNPNFENMSTNQKQTIVKDLVADAKIKVNNRMKTGKLPKTLDMLRILASEKDSKIKKVMDWMEIEGDLEDIVEKEDALGTLKKIKYYVDNYDKIFNSDLKLD